MRDKESKLNRAHQRRAVTQAVGRCFVDGFQGQGQTSGNTGPEKATAYAAQTYPTTQQLYQGAGDAGKARPEESFASAATNHRLELGTQGRGFESREDASPSSSNLAIMIVFTMCPFCKPAGLLNVNCNVLDYNCI